MKSAVSLLAIAAAIVVAGCGTSHPALARTAGVAPPPDMGPGGDYPMILGDAFVVDGVTYTPADTLNYDAVGYAGESGGAGISGAHRTLPVPSYVDWTSPISALGNCCQKHLSERTAYGRVRLYDR